MLHSYVTAKLVLFQQLDVAPVLERLKADPCWSPLVGRADLFALVLMATHVARLVSRSTHAGSGSKEIWDLHNLGFLKRLDIGIYDVIVERYSEKVIMSSYQDCDILWYQCVNQCNMKDQISTANSSTKAGVKGLSMYSEGFIILVVYWDNTFGYKSWFLFL